MILNFQLNSSVGSADTSSINRGRAKLLTGFGNRCIRFVPVWSLFSILDFAFSIILFQNVINDFILRVKEEPSFEASASGEQGGDVAERLNPFFYLAEVFPGVFYHRETEIGLEEGEVFIRGHVVTTRETDVHGGNVKGSLGRQGNVGGVGPVQCFFEFG